MFKSDVVFPKHRPFEAIHEVNLLDRFKKGLPLNIDDVLRGIINDKCLPYVISKGNEPPRSAVITFIPVVPHDE
jgi:hypothetical protein